MTANHLGNRARPAEHDMATTTQNTPPPSTTRWILLGLLFLTTAIGTYRSFSLYSQDNPDIPIHQLTRIPPAALLSTHTTDIKATTTTLPYFANKSNFLNQKFVKLGWAWTTFVVWFHSIAIASCYFGTHPHQEQQPRTASTASSSAASTQKKALSDRAHPSSHVPRILSLHLIATLFWILFTQWCFGSSLIERVLILSGAKCIPSLKSLHSTSAGSSPVQQPLELENLYCQHRWGRRLPGLDKFVLSTYKPYWSEGIDVSGHAFLLTFSILLIVTTLRPSLQHLFAQKKRPESEEERLPRNYRLAIYANLGLLAVWWWMLLMTSLYFHGPVEKFAGLITASGAWILVEGVVDRLLG
ncbi:hypothetical protein, variant [Puccinia triticina 1-1 BBBD Race 1]|uniref:Uncharacterized protein n=1 Tax=Puccinia triticina (isolate 1-1 / race 1 (BBBD)) TaxID=630390 RepID=A0A180GNS6_PUCT1|nr:hypothetical protein PTTG_03067 [Puccinia triticina 1-1 BBBD Race 1]OAV94458.1 hypothetical protein, variant [Puccinia triticina 1-1 BBBD Race 1]